MHSRPRLLMLAFMVAHGLAAVLPRARQPCPHYEPEGELVDEYIVELHDHQSLDDHFRNIGMDLRQEGTDFFRHLEELHSYRARLTEDFIHNVVRFDPAVRSVERGAILEFHFGDDIQHEEQQFNLSTVDDSHLLPRDVPNWSIVERPSGHHMQQVTAGKKIELDGKDHIVHMLFGAGDGVDIYVMDSGIRTTHTMFKDGRASHFNGPETPYTYTLRTVEDQEGHGTHVAGIAAGHRSGVAQWANLINVKVGCNDLSICKGYTGGVIHAINDVVKAHNEKKATAGKEWKGSVMNMSFGLVAKSNLLNKAIDRAYDAGIPIAVAAGNKVDGDTVDADGTLCGSHNTICVGGVNKDYSKGWFSRGGPLVDIWAPGDYILSAGIKDDKDMRFKTGTSMATAVVSGIMATIVGYEELRENAQLVYERLRNNALTGIVGNLHNENNLFAQTGIMNSGDHPYYGPGADWNPVIDPYGMGPMASKRAGKDSHSGSAVIRRIYAPDVEGYRTLGIQDEDPNDAEPALITQEETLELDEAEGGFDVDMPEIEDVMEGGEPGRDPPMVGDKPICDGNQVQQDCVGGVLPPVDDYSGSQAPICMKADGSEGSYPRLNANALREAAAGYCKEVVDSRWLLKEGAPNPNPAVVAGAAEGGASMALSIMFHKGSCPEDQSTSEMDFGTLGIDKCVEYLSDTIGHLCVLDKSWGGAWNPDFEVMGGVWATDCAMFSVFGQ
ncbi:hypothetical protein DL769_009027 [Monosporascus sp. CRB-8-3]|nr:hypothetical protein DL769_009027 [Monosporascus sp. CRB-8-3]